MKNNILFNILLVVLLFATSACTKEKITDIEDEPKPAISDVPLIDSLTLNLTSVREFQDSLIFSFYYLDGNGDLGHENADSASVFVTDMRDSLNLVFRYHLSPRAPAGADINVQGRLHLVLKNIIRLNPSAASETTTFGIRIKDRAGNWSNTLRTGTVTVTS